MWYAIWTKTGKEEALKNICSRCISEESYEEMFIPQYERKKKYMGSWHLEKKALFPGYVFFETKDPVELHYKLKKIPQFTKILNDEHSSFIPVRESEKKNLNLLLGIKRVVDLSYGIIVGDKVCITSGPLINFSGNIKKINRHKRIATIEIPVLGKLTTANVGLEVISKK